MLIPDDLRTAIAKYTSKINQKQLIKEANIISRRYRAESGKGKALVTTQNEVLAYSCVRMPATYGATYSALKYSLKELKKTPTTLLDVGAGTGAATWAATNLQEFRDIICFEREEAMSRLGQQLMKESEGQLKLARWIQGDILKSSIKVSADLVIASYVFNEMSDKDREAGILKLWEATNMMLILVEPGTPAGYKGLMQARRLLLGHGGHMIAPCPHEDKCPLD